MKHNIYKKISIFLILSILLWVNNLSSFASFVLWPSEMNLYNDTINLDYVLSTTSTASNSKKGFLLTGDIKEIFTLGAGHIAINATLSGKSHLFIQYLEGLKKRGLKITLILCNDKPSVGMNPKNAPKDFQNPYFYMIDFNANNGTWQKYNFDRILNDYGKYVDNWIIGNEINGQTYNYYGPANCKDYTKVYCDSFKIMYEKIKEKYENANVFISFDQGWDLPSFRSNQKTFDKIMGQYRYNAKEQLNYINEFLGPDIDWGVALHPYPAPVEEAMFWDDDYAGFDDNAEEEKDRPYLITTKNFDIALAYINQIPFMYKKSIKRKVLISEIGFTSHNGEEIQAAGLYYLWQKICKYDQILALLYNAHTDLPDNYHFGLVDEKNRKRLIWAVFKDMDRENENVWCKSLLDRILEEHDCFAENGFIYKKSTESEIK